MLRSIVLVLAMSGCWYGKPVLAPHSPATAPVVAESAETSYRSETIAADAVGVVTMTAGLVGLERGANENVSGAVIVTSMAIAGFADPIIHLAHGHGQRALASYLIRVVTTTSGMMAGIAFEACRDELFCGLDGMLWGTAAGLAVAGVADALVLHDQHTWTPTVIPSDGGGRVGLARTW